MEALKENKGQLLVTVLGVFEIGLIIAGGYLLGQLVGNKDTANDLGKTVLPVTFTLASIVLLHTFLWYWYSTYNPLSMNLYFLMATSFSIIISLTALSIAIVNKS
jgi:hypothetical protein